MLRMLPLSSRTDAKAMLQIRIDLRACRYIYLSISHLYPRLCYVHLCYLHGCFCVCMRAGSTSVLVLPCLIYGFLGIRACSVASLACITRRACGIGSCAILEYPKLPPSVHPGVVTGQALTDLLK
jgi:hypothetical protein